MSLEHPLAFVRLFQIWSYTVSHGQLLLRSTKASDAQTRIDVLFKDVGMVCLSASCDGLDIQEVSPQAVKLKGDEAFLRNRKVYQIKSKNLSGYIVAGAVFHHEDKGEYDEPSHLLP